MAIHRVTHTFTAGELSPLMQARVDFDRYNNGCKKLHNMLSVTQGPATRRSGTRFIFNMEDIPYGVEEYYPVRMIPFIFNEDQAYVLIFYRSGYNDAGLGYPNEVGMVVATGDGLVVQSGNLTECPPGTPITQNPGKIFMLLFQYNFPYMEMDYVQAGDTLFLTMGRQYDPLYPNPGDILNIVRYAHDCWHPIYPELVDPPPEWEATGYPETVELHQQRLVYGASFIDRQKVWMSQAGDFYNFGDDIGSADGPSKKSAVTFTLASKSHNRIEWMLSSKALLLGTRGDEWTVTSFQAAIAFDDLVAKRQTNVGSEPIKPLLIGEMVLFVERHGRTVNEFVYDYTYDSYKISDIAILSTHLTEHFPIVSWGYQQTPDSIIWCIRDDGALLGITYQRQHKVVGWHVHSTKGNFIDVTTIPGDDQEDEVWVIVRRPVGSGNWWRRAYFIEKFFPRFKGDKASEGRFLDSAQVYKSDIATDTVAGLAHLEGREVDVLADGQVLAPMIVRNWELQLPGFYKEIVVGLRYVSELRPTLADLSLQNGSAIGRSQRITSLDLDFYKSGGVWIGKYTQEDARLADFDEDGGEYEEHVPFRISNDEMGEEVPLYTGIYHMDFPEGFDRNSVYFIRQKQPLPLTIRSVTDTIEVYE